MMEDQIVTIAPRATAFTVVCDRCAAGDPEDPGIEAGWAGVTFAGSLDLDLDRGVFLCRRGHTVRVVRTRRAVPASSTEAA
ncbi:MAG TPA: hypothetical protein VNH40_09385 [Gaiellaceae bacterium]|nr:hypothetical protein [Gaiellaceae bacterium]